MRGSPAGDRGYPLLIVLTRILLASTALAVAFVPAALAQTVERAMTAPFRSVPGAVPAHLESSVAAVEPVAEAWASMAVETHVRLRDVPLGPGRSATLVLHRVEPFTADARIVVARRTK